jgi:hypothetical protein
MNSDCTRVATIVAACNLRQRAAFIEPIIKWPSANANNSTLEAMSNDSRPTVWVVVDREFGVQLEDLPVHEEIWVVRSPANSAAAVRLRESRSGITTFAGDSDAVPDELLVGILGTIDMHYGGHSPARPCFKMKAHGARLTKIVEKALSEFGFDKIQSTPDGFVAEKSAQLPNPV